jgi:hypothetical protein
MKSFWMTVSLPANDENQAARIAQAIAKRCNGRVVQVQQEPPQGATIVGDLHEDGI